MADTGREERRRVPVEVPDPDERSTTPRTDRSMQTRYPTTGLPIPQPAAERPTNLPMPGSLSRDEQEVPGVDDPFGRMWNAHPHNHQSDDALNTSDDQLAKSLGFNRSWNTCAIRISIMLNAIGQPVTPERCAAAGLRAPWRSPKTGLYYLLSASDVGTYLEANLRKADVEIGPYANTKQDHALRNEELRTHLEGKRGIIQFDKVFTFEGTGHVDLFFGMRLSDAPFLYAAKTTRLWYV